MEIGIEDDDEDDYEDEESDVIGEDDEGKLIFTRSFYIMTWV